MEREEHIVLAPHGATITCLAAQVRTDIEIPYKNYNSEATCEHTGLLDILYGEGVSMLGGGK